MNSIYIALSHAIPKEEERYLVDEIEKMFEKLSDSDILRVIEMMYDNLEKKSGIQLGLLFIKGLRESNFFEYVHFVRGLNAARKK